MCACACANRTGSAEQSSFHFYMGKSSGMFAAAAEYFFCAVCTLLLCYFSDDEQWICECVCAKIVVCLPSMM